MLKKELSFQTFNDKSCEKVFCNKKIKYGYKKDTKQRVFGRAIRLCTSEINFPLADILKMTCRLRLAFE